VSPAGPQEWRLSGGERRRLEIARCLVCEPLLILLDEPFTGIDPITIADIRQIVHDLRDTGIGILLTDHNVREALKVTDRSYLIKDGKVRTHGTPQQIIMDQSRFVGHLALALPPNRSACPIQMRRQARIENRNRGRGGSS
jgi:ABC-type lipopolysaccharide export system ATPase subunit